MVRGRYVAVLGNTRGHRGRQGPEVVMSATLATSGALAPYADLDEILRFARHYGAQYLVADTYTMERVRPQLLPLSDHDQLPGLRLVHEAQGEGRTARIFALDPAPPPSDEIGPSLGFTGDG